MIPPGKGGKELGCVSEIDASRRFWMRMMRTVNMLELRREYALFRDEVRAAIDEVLEGGQYILGPAVTNFEKALAERIGTPHALTISNGTDALLCAMMALGVGRGDEVILPAFTFFATAGTVARLGATPVFVDINPKTFNLDSECVEPAITPRTKAIVAVHLFGQCAEMDALQSIACRHDLKIIEDAAQAIDARYNGRNAGSLGDIACFSFYPTKNLGGFGEGGLIATDNAALFERCRQLRNHGESTRYHHEQVGGNFRLNSIQCAILQVKLKYLAEFTRKRRANAAKYDALLGDAGVTVPFVPVGHEPVYHQYSILSERRDELVTHLKENGIGSGIYYPVPLHLQKCFSELGYRPGSLPITEDACRRILSLPCHPMLEVEDIEYVAQCVRRFHETRPGAVPARAAASVVAARA